jgi:hypothetical protein
MKRFKKGMELRRLSIHCGLDARVDGLENMNKR